MDSIFEGLLFGAHDETQKSIEDLSDFTNKMAVLIPQMRVPYKLGFTWKYFEQSFYLPYLYLQDPMLAWSKNPLCRGLQEPIEDLSHFTKNIVLIIPQIYVPHKRGVNWKGHVPAFYLHFRYRARSTHLDEWVTRMSPSAVKASTLMEAGNPNKSMRPQQGARVSNHTPRAGITWLGRPDNHTPT